MSGMVRTVRGDVPAETIGRIVFHEHLLYDLVRPAERAAVDDAPITLANRWQVDYRSNENRNNARQTDPQIAATELERFSQDGGSLLVDQSTFGIGRDPEGLRAASGASGVHVVAAAGTYVADYLDAETLALDIDGLEARFIAEVESGLDGTMVRAGLIGEIGTSYPILPVERRALVAAARASRRTGAAISVHPGRHRDAPFEIVSILSEAGADLSRVVICHMDRTYPDGSGVRELLATGVCVEWDFFGIEQSHYWFGEVELPTDLQRLHLIRRLFDEGWADRILVSHDICTCTRMTHWGGHGYGHLLRNGPDLMARAGFSPEQIDILLRRTPLRLLTLDVPTFNQE
ncbi:aryldialkylphosphatase [Arsenicitalea aurantiaca]|uniref:Aryldialkylphosphatase n=1 Tax=Arsenicitalea aurantiaca TaxID=1783274 RepID=A0A433XEI1_9HYPH|nr:aryldialkylphosphatase [Arsenicitalea aurantiaca]RUT32460.1 aryldialkylphosphatase [Arsenicitalea aurantiaca]